MVSDFVVSAGVKPIGPTNKETEGKKHNLFAEILTVMRMFLLNNAC